jgi:hypothetical protein
MARATLSTRSLPTAPVAAGALLAPAIGAWPAVLLVSAAMAAAAWTRADARVA